MPRIAIVLVLFLVAAAFTPPALAVPKLKPQTAPTLDQGRALLVLVIEAPLRVAELALTRPDGRVAAVLVVDAPADEYSVRIYSVPVGRYRISAVRLPSLQRSAFPVAGTPELDLKAARINYAGNLVLEPDGDGLKGRFQNHSGRLVTVLRERYAALLAAAPLAFVGGEDDGWFRSNEGTR